MSAGGAWMDGMIGYAQPFGLTRPMWCAGCDEVMPPLLMGWTDSGLYRCVACRGVDVIVDPDGSGPRLWAAFSSRD